MKKMLSFAVCGMLVMSMSVSSYAIETQKAGCQNNEVREIQEMLISAGYLAEGEADGIFGPKTEAAVLAFQQDNSLDATGMVGEATFGALKSGGAAEAGEAVEEAAAEAGEAVEEAAAEAGEAVGEAADEAEEAVEEAADEAGEAVEEAAD